MTQSAIKWDGAVKPQEGYAKAGMVNYNLSRGGIVNKTYGVHKNLYV